MPSVRPALAHWCCLPPIPRTSNILRPRAPASSRVSPFRNSVWRTRGWWWASSVAAIFPYLFGEEEAHHHPRVGLFFGGMLPYLFGGIAMTAVGRAAGAV